MTDTTTMRQDIVCVGSCGRLLPVTAFPTLRRGHGRGTKCRECVADDAVPGRSRPRSIVCSNGHLRTPENTDYDKRGVPRCRDCRRPQTLRAMANLRTAAIMAYGGRCRCCGEAEVVFLQLDHINNDGKVRRGRGGAWKELRRLRDAGWPGDVLQVLCANCHQAKTCKVECPHVGKKGVRQ